MNQRKKEKRIKHGHPQGTGFRHYHLAGHTHPEGKPLYFVFDVFDANLEDSPTIQLIHKGRKP